MVARGDPALHDRDALRGLPRLSPQARGAGGQDRRPAHRRGEPALGQRGDRMGQGPAGEARRQAQRDRPANPEGDRRPAHLPARRRARLSHARAFVRHAVGRREPAHPARFADRLGPHRRALCARRAVDRPPPARQRAAARYAQAPAGPGQYGDRRRARRGCDLGRRLRRRCRPGRRRARGRDRRRGNAGRNRRQSQFADRPLSLGRADGRDPGQAPRPPIPAASSRSSARAATTSRTSRRRFRSGSSPASPASRAAANRRWSSTRCTRRRRAA